MTNFEKKDRVQQFKIGGRWGTCVDCPRDENGFAYPLGCIHTTRYDHQLTRESLIEQLCMDMTKDEAESLVGRKK